MDFFKNETEGTTEEYQIRLSDNKLIGSLAFLTDISNHLNILNVKLKGKKQQQQQQQLLFRSNKRTRFEQDSERSLVII